MRALFTAEPLNDHIIRFRDVTKTGMYLVKGRKRAVLIDTGTGIGDLRLFAEPYLDLPYDIILTHGHVDHGSGAGLFTDQAIYLHPRDRELLRVHTAFENRRLYASHAKVGMEITDDLLAPIIDPDQTRPLYDGQIFDLGGLRLEIIEAPGHTKGICAILLQEDRLLLTGDACGNNVLLIEDCATTVSEYTKTLRKLMGYSGQYDRILRNHGTCESEKDLIDNVLDCCEAVMAGTDDHVPEPHTAIACENAYRAKAVDSAHIRLDGKAGNIIYRSDRVN